MIESFLDMEIYASTHSLPFLVESLLKNYSTMKFFIIISTLFLSLMIAVLSAPIPQDVGVPNLAKDIGFCTLVTILSFGTVVLSHYIQGAIASHNNHKAIDHYFDELRKFEAEKGYVA